MSELQRTRAGELRKKISVATFTRSLDAYGENVISSTGLKSVWGKIEPLSGRERWQAHQTHPEVSHKITLRYNGTITPDKQLGSGAQIFEPVAVLNIDSRDRVQVVLAKEIV